MKLGYDKIEIVGIVTLETCVGNKTAMAILSCQEHMQSKKRLNDRAPSVAECFPAD